MERAHGTGIWEQDGVRIPVTTDRPRARARARQDLGGATDGTYRTHETNMTERSR